MRASRAFSLVELLIVLAIIGITAAIAAPRYGGAVSRYRAQLGGQRLAEELRAAGERARAGAARVVVTLDANADTVSAVYASGPSSGQAIGSASLSAAPYRADLHAVTIQGGGTTFAFAATGEAEADASAAVRAGDMSVTVSIAAGQFEPQATPVTIAGSGLAVSVTPDIDVLGGAEETE